MSKLLTINSDETAVTIAPATLTDVVASVASTTQTVTGMYGLLQRAGLFVAGMSVQNIRVGQGWNPFK